MSGTNSDATENARVSTQDRRSSVREDGDDPVVAPSTPPKPLPRLSDPFENEIPKPDGDPYNYFLKPMLEKDSIQCNAWKEEVQNILIFAGLFSAVVTAFIVESYQRLRPDPNDTIIGLLAHIAQRIDNTPQNGTAPVSLILANTSFAPSRSDISINICWFISLVFSLTVALIGIITLQWLREHQRYDSNLAPQETFAILNSRLHGLWRWYVPQIFGGLPLLLQAALVLFLAGIIEFLFALHLEVAIPVTLSICIPLVFLVGTTLLPILQVYILQDPFRLAVNDDIPAPCPYKSPQSFIAQCLGTISTTSFKILAFIVMNAYKYITAASLCAKRFLGYRMPIFRSQTAQFSRRLGEGLPSTIGRLRYPGGHWASLDRIWLEVRTNYATLLQMEHLDGGNGMRTNLLELSLCREVYDCTYSFHGIKKGGSSQVDDNALYHCMEALCVEQVRAFAYATPSLGFDPDTSATLADLCFAFGRFLEHEGVSPPYSRLSISFFEDLLLDHLNNTDVPELLQAIFLGTSLHTIIPYWSLGNMQAHWSELNRRFIVARLYTEPARLFEMADSDAWVPSWMLRNVYSLPQDYSAQITLWFHKFLDDCSTMRPTPTLALRPGPARQSYGVIATYVDVVMQHQIPNNTRDTIEFLTQLLSDEVDYIQGQPFTLLMACLYVNSLIACGWPAEELDQLRRLICSLCEITVDRISDDRQWAALDEAVDYMYRHHTNNQVLSSMLTTHLVGPAPLINPDACNYDTT
ncbi:hypothetical protein D9619_004697 [Psilocybe cf. subviscida]|uniref:DUF6535 domain-containing protein n=1 Tax=Psilocybe cf. subviscida TaxID=2480587 RepID=A0A8H5F8A9_9AGAR|nr:hypothetical protein D9619_004697 [Psilocybe cf. subviscida]